jgi:soluble lytic murein transglycosylase-like protein
MKIVMGRKISGWAVVLFLGIAGTPLQAEFVSLLKAKYDAAVKAAALRHGLDPSLVHAVIRAESGYNRWAISTAGAQGLMQLMPATASFYGVGDSFDPDSNIEGGVKYLKDLSGLYAGRTDLILAAYNAGQSAVQKYNGVPPYPETRAYIERVKIEYGRDVVRGKTRIFSFVDASGRTIITNDVRLAWTQSRRP